VRPLRSKGLISTPSRARLVASVLLLAGLLACAPSPLPSPSPTAPPTGLTPISLPAGYGAEGGWYEIYFTNPLSTVASSLTGGPDGPLVESINSARVSVDVAAYSLTLNSVRSALIDAHNRGVTVRMVMESDNMDGSDVRKLMDAGVPIVGDGQAGLMHDKFMVIDRSEVWTGSMNFTDSGAYKDDNNLIHIRSQDLAQNYTTEFDEMFTDRLFGPNLRADTPHPEIVIDDTRIETLFSPDDTPGVRLGQLIKAARESIYFLAYSFTSDDLGQALIQQSQAGVKVSGVMEADQVKANQGTEYDPLSQAGIDVRLDGNPDEMHHKVFIIDGEIVVLGSYNFSASAETSNDENMLIIYSPDLAGQFLQEFQRVYARARSPQLPLTPTP
jgi:phosphatidylserine/phosphatidylglycerophosphate/cardiolipin synthase-like enzyme